jgi:uncharacterized protein
VVRVFRGSNKKCGRISPFAFFNVHPQILNDSRAVFCETMRRLNNIQNKSRPVFLRHFYRVLAAGLLIYVAACLGCASYQRKLIYFPPQLTAEQVDESARKSGLERWVDSSGRAIGMRRLSSKQPAAGRVLIVYGNGGCAIWCAHYADDIQNIAAFDVFILEYPGYADRAGSPSQESIFHAADEALQLLGTNQPVYLLGESLGSGVAAYLAGTHPGEIAGMILLSPYNRLTSVAQEHMPYLPVWLILVDRFPSEDYLRHYHGPVGIMVDGRDTVVPEKFGLRLYDGYAGPKRLWSFPDGGHISIMEPSAMFWGAVLAFWQTNRSGTN